MSTNPYSSQCFMKKLWNTGAVGGPGDAAGSEGKQNCRRAVSAVDRVKQWEHRADLIDNLAVLVVR